MYQLFKMATEIYDDIGPTISNRDETLIVSKLIWHRANNLCFAIQQRHEVAIKRAYVGFIEDNKLPYLVDLDFIDTFKESSQKDENKLKELLIKKLDNKISKHLLNAKDLDWLIVAIHYVEEIKFDDHQNNEISRFMDLDFATICFDEDSQKNVYQSYSCGDHDSGYYSSSVGKYDDPKYVSLLKIQKNQKGIAKIIKDSIK